MTAAARRIMSLVEGTTTGNVVALCAKSAAAFRRRQLPLRSALSSIGAV